MATPNKPTTSAAADNNETATAQTDAKQLERERLAREAEEKAQREADERRAALEASPAAENAGIDDSSLLLKSKRSESDDRRNRSRRPKDAGDDSLYEEPITLATPDAFKNRQGVELLMKACHAYNLNPDPTLTVFIHGRHEPDPRLPYREVLAWNYYEGSGSVPNRVVIVTAGGAKLSYPPDAAAFDVLRNVFKAFTVDPITKQLVPGELPPDLALPIETVTGIPITDKHILRRGYLREGGRAGADRRDAAERRGLSDAVAVPGTGTRMRGA
jgi:hypothetical protein